MVLGKILTLVPLLVFMIHEEEAPEFLELGHPWQPAAQALLLWEAGITAVHCSRAVSA